MKHEFNCDQFRTDDIFYLKYPNGHQIQKPRRIKKENSHFISDSANLWHMFAKYSIVQSSLYNDSICWKDSNNL